jgi:hypothetical protein
MMLFALIWSDVARKELQVELLHHRAQVDSRRGDVPLWRGWALLLLSDAVSFPCLANTPEKRTNSLDRERGRRIFSGQSGLRPALVTRIAWKKGDRAFRCGLLGFCCNAGLGCIYRPEVEATSEVTRLAA